MAYMSQDRKASLAPGIKAVLKKYGMKGTLSVDNHAGLCVTLKSGKIDFQGARGVNPYWIERDFQGVAKNFLVELKDAMSKGNWDNSDIQTDYFDKGWYVYINIGKWNNPYVLEK